MSEQQPNQTKQMSGSKLFAIIVAAILTCAAVIGALFAINAYDEQKRRNKAVLGQVRYETLKFRKQMMHTEGGFFDPGSQEWKLYIEWVGSADKGTTEEQIARRRIGAQT